MAAQMGGAEALAVAALIGERSPSLSANDKTVLSHFLDGEMTFSTPSGTGTITVTAQSVTCRSSNIDLAMHSCQLNFGSTTITEAGTRGEALWATMIAGGVPGNPGAGSIYFSMAPVTCTVNVTQIQSGTGAGVSCTYTPNGA